MRPASPSSGPRAHALRCRWRTDGAPHPVLTVSAGHSAQEARRRVSRPVVGAGRFLQNQSSKFRQPRFVILSSHYAERNNEARTFGGRSLVGSGRADGSTPSWWSVSLYVCHSSFLVCCSSSCERRPSVNASSATCNGERVRNRFRTERARAATGKYRRLDAHSHLASDPQSRAGLRHSGRPMAHFWPFPRPKKRRVRSDVHL